jgi:hypothetical protein
VHVRWSPRMLTPGQSLPGTQHVKSGKETYETADLSFDLPLRK